MPPGRWPILNALRANTALYPCPATVASLGVSNASCRLPVVALAPLTDAGSAAARIDQLFRERAFWLYMRGTRVEDLRRLMRQYPRTRRQVWPTGPFFKGGTYGTDVNFPIPQSEQNNPVYAEKGGQCTNRSA